MDAYDYRQADNAALEAARRVLGHAAHYPHLGGCAGCREEKRCNVCGDRASAGRCTNGRCPTCHGRECVSRGAEVHGYGRLRA